MARKRLWLKLFVMLLLFCIALTGCASTPKGTSIQFVNAVEVLGKNGAPFQGRLLKIVSKGNGLTESSTVRENALIRATWEIYQLGYEYFMIFSEDKGVSHNSHTTPGNATTTIDSFGNAYTTYNPGYTYNTTTYSVILIIAGCSEDELLDNVPTFSVSSRLSQAQYYFDKEKNKSGSE